MDNHTEGKRNGYTYKSKSVKQDIENNEFVKKIRKKC